MEKITDGFKGEKAIVTPYNIRNYQAGNKITKQLYVTHIGYYPTAKYHFRERLEGANEHILIYCESGSGWIVFNDAEINLTKNQAFIIPALSAHSYGTSNTDPWTIYWLHFCGKNIPLFASIIGKRLHIDDSDRSRINDRFSLFEAMYQNLEMGYNPENLEYVSFCLMHFLASLKYIDQYTEIKNVKKTDIIQQSIVYMKENLENRITLEDIASSVGYSVSHFGALFIEKISYSPMMYYNQLKIQRSCSYLQFSDLKINEIAFKLGYYDPFHFSKAFKQEMELTPKEYRKRYKKIRILQ